METPGEEGEGDLEFLLHHKVAALMAIIALAAILI